MKNQQLSEEAYQIVIEKAKELYSTNQKMTCEQLIAYLNSKLPSDFQYDGVRSVFRAAWDRADDDGKEALENSFLDKNGNPLLK